MWRMSNLSAEEKLRFENIVDMGLAYSAMIRLFVKGEKVKLQEQFVNSTAERLFNITSKQEFDDIHSDFCKWGIKNIFLAERKRNGIVIKSKGPASYGQIAKTLDVLLKVVVYYCHLPDLEGSNKLCPWINAAVDTNMMRELRENYPNEVQPSWPTAIEEVQEKEYLKIQELVRRAIRELHNDKITPPQYDDIHWRLANQKYARS